MEKAKKKDEAKEFKSDAKKRHNKSLKKTIDESVFSKMKFGLINKYYSLFGVKSMSRDSDSIYGQFKTQLGIKDSSSPKNMIHGIGKKIRRNMLNTIPMIDRESFKKIMEDKTETPISDKINCVLCNAGLDQKQYTSIEKERLFKNVLVANRGEIAIRIIRACKELGIKTTLIHSKHDQESLAVKYADNAYCLDDYEGKVSNGYLDPERIVKIAKKAKADAIHPGYGFLSENVEFAKRTEDAGIKFIGPHSQTIFELGDKSIAKDTMKNNNVPVVEGSDHIDTAEEAKKFGISIGFPVIVKAAEGGGGKGMRIVKKEKEFVKMYDSALAEAKAAFNSEKMFVEKYISKPRHIEFQILADQHGNVVHFGERDCSIQRRHQKLVEEAPSPALDESLRNIMGEAAIRAAKAVKYEGVGTVEFLLDEDNSFYFMEMNTRIQVEHGVTEMITGVDLVKEQILVAAGAKIAHVQEDIKINGWAIECRINAEDPMADFTPSPGTIADYLPPGGPGIRVCSCAHSGFVISPFYDSMIAKLITTGQNRDEAIDRMKRALDEYVIKGLKTTIPFHKVVIRNRDFRKGRVTTDFIDKNKIMKQLEKTVKKAASKALKDDKTIAIISAAVAMYLKEKQEQVLVSGPPSGGQDNWTLASRMDSINSLDSENGTF